MNSPSYESMTVSIKDIKIPKTNPPIKINKNSESYQKLLKGIREYGVVVPICVFRSVSKKTQKVTYKLVDGYRRLAASIDLGLQEIPIRILERR